MIQKLCYYSVTVVSDPLRFHGLHHHGNQAFWSFTISWSLLKLMSTESVMLTNDLILCRILLLPPKFRSISVFSNELALHIKWPMYWSFSFSIGPSNEYSGLISLGLTGLIFLLSKSFQKSSPTPQFKSINSLALSILYSPTLTSIHDYWKNIAWTRWTFVDKVMSLLFNILSRLVITFLPRSKIILISWLQSPSSVVLEPRKMKSATISTVSPSICHKVMGLDAMILVF